MKPHASLYINGEWISGNGDPFSSVNPGTYEQIWSGHAASNQQVADACESAQNAFPIWSALTLKQRIKYLATFNTILEDHSELFADTIGQETGKPLWEARTEVSAMLGKLALTLQAYQERCKHEQNSQQGVTSSLEHRPHGIIAVFGPYNFPGHLPNGHILPALLAGNTLIFKPSEHTPRTAELMVHLWQKAELPDGVLNLVQGGVEVGKALAEQPMLNGIFFTGSATTGCYLHQQFAGQPEKMLALEMGGNNPLLVADISELEAAVVTTLQSAFITAGQRCTCARRLIVIDTPNSEAYIKHLVNTARQLDVGLYNQQPAPFMGALISKQAQDMMLQAQSGLLEKGAKPLLEMALFNHQSALLTPGILDCTDANNIADEEYFGPLLQLYRVENLQQAVTMANDTRFGLSAGLLSDDPTDFSFFQQRMRSGLINWNRPITGASSARPFGGTGLSGNHRPSAWYAADYCAYPVASQQSDKLAAIETLPPGVHLS